VILGGFEAIFGSSLFLGTRFSILGRVGLISLANLKPNAVRIVRLLEVPGGS
jgi:hypothetical protein